VSQRVLVPVASDPTSFRLKNVERLLTQTLVDAARLGHVELIPMRVVEPVSLNAVLDILPYLQRTGGRRIVVVTPLFRSRRTALVYDHVLSPAEITVLCDHGPNFRTNTWLHTWHGVQNVAEQWVKLQYYRLYVLPLAYTTIRPPPRLTRTLHIS
jgi:hypothetical protein